MRAAWLAVAFVALVLVSGAVALLTGDAWLSALLVHRRPPDRPVDVHVDHVAMLVAVGVLQGWALWRVLPGRRAAARPDPDARLLRAVLYVWLAAEFLDHHDLAWLEVAGDVATVAVVVLFHRVTRGGSRVLRWAALVAGLYDAVSGLTGLYLPAGHVPWLVWMVLTLVVQARDGRWGRTTLWAGAVIAARPFLMPVVSGLLFRFAGFPSRYVWEFGAELAFDVLTLAWIGAFARDLGNPPRAPRPVRPRRPVRRWEAVAAALPLLPAAAGLASGTVLWIGPRGAVASWFAGQWYLRHLWLSLDVLVGLGAASGLVLAAAVWRTRRLVPVAVAALLLTAAAGVLSAATASRLTPSYEQVPIFPDWVLTGDPALSPLWHSAALTASALLLLMAYGDRAARRRPYQVVLAGTATVAALILVPGADQATGRITTALDCRSHHDDLAPAGAARRFICAVRTGTALPAVEGMPDHRLLAYGRRMCGVYTRADHEEAVRFQRSHGVDPRDHTLLLEPVCPRAAEMRAAEVAREERAVRAVHAEEQAKCRRAARHRPLLQPVRAVRQPEPLWAELPLHAYESEDDPWDDRRLAGVRTEDLVASVPGHLVVLTDPNRRVCITTETYARRPPVETKGWHHVVEVGHRSTGGTIVLVDNLSGVVLPDLALRGRKGHYRIRVHFAWIAWKGEKRAGQRLLIMAYPGRGDQVTVHRERVEP
ncbi:hypothetical protein [Nonomuraea sp. SBT364]|uniref:hypothetical protein n=1 Tax=Nonomuraea sp. SBT364 TaxID=1580530 RepID=UPI00066CB858|nr:hypothetical protein [Nonomuraea sp. SBT364]